jgi:transposase-like protein
MARRLQSMDELFKGRHFEREIIVLCVRFYGDSFVKPF